MKYLKFEFFPEGFPDNFAGEFNDFATKQVCVQFFFF